MVEILVTGFVWLIGVTVVLFVLCALIATWVDIHDGN